MDVVFAVVGEIIVLQWLLVMGREKGKGALTITYPTSLTSTHEKGEREKSG
jgi:hypothetical protein